MSDDKPFGEWAIVEIMGHRVYAGFVTEQIIAGKGFIRIDVPSDPAYTKVFGPDAVFSISPCEELTARNWAARSVGQSGAKLLAPPNQFTTVPAPVPISETMRNSPDGLVCFDESHFLTPADMEMFAKSLVVETDDTSCKPIYTPNQDDVDEFDRAHGIQPHPIPIVVDLRNPPSVADAIADDEQPF